MSVRLFHRGKVRPRRIDSFTSRATPGFAPDRVRVFRNSRVREHQEEPAKSMEEPRRQLRESTPNTGLDLHFSCVRVPVAI